MFDDADRAASRISSQKSRSLRTG